MWHRHSLQLHLGRDVWRREQRARSEDWQVLTSFPAKSRPFENALPLSHPASCRASAVILRRVIDPLIEPVPVFGQSLDDPHYAGRRHVVGMARMRGNSARKNRRPCRTATALQEEGTNLIDCSSARAAIACVCKNSTKDIPGKKHFSILQTKPCPQSGRPPIGLCRFRALV